MLVIQMPGIVKAKERLGPGIQPVGLVHPMKAFSFVNALCRWYKTAFWQTNRSILRSGLLRRTGQVFARDAHSPQGDIIKRLQVMAAMPLAVV